MAFMTSAISGGTIAVIIGVVVASALVRGFLSEMFRAFSTWIVAFGISFIRKNLKMFMAGTITFLTLAITLRSICNAPPAGHRHFSCLLVILMLVSAIAGLKREKVI